MFLIICNIDSIRQVFSQLSEHKRGCRVSRSVAIHWSNRDLDSMTHDELHFVNVGNADGVVNSYKSQPSQAIR